MKACVLDTETGGVGAEAAQRWSIIQVGACIYNDGCLLPGVNDSFECVIDESKAGLTLYLDPEALAVNGFTVERIRREGVHPGLAVMRLATWLHSKFGPITPESLVTLMGHNIGYDVTFLQRLFRLAGCLDAYHDIFHYRTIDTSSIRRYLIEANAASKDDLELKPEKPHDALSDAIATGHLFVDMLEYTNPVSRTPPGWRGLSPRQEFHRRYL